ncbi:MAG: hypothetical protein AYK22_06150 [Thermoplasmatales archaeon SG8-52-3]|nr:MAG: hypothetical protein AYK22_06150 [Thermoplasmatales archaeon SG8-52-3]
MRKNLRTVKTGIIFGTLLLSLFVAFIPSASAGLLTVDPLINLRYPIQEENIIPNSGVLDIPLETTFKLTGPLAGIVEGRSLLSNTDVQIELKVVQTPDWCTASIANPLAQLVLNSETPYQSTLTVTVTENAPAFTQGVVRISATSKLQRGLLFNIGQVSVEFDISFIIGYWSVVSYELPDGNYLEVGPLGIADFQIDIENIGNGPTYVGIEVVDIPEDQWSVSIASSVQLSSTVYGGEGIKETVHLKIKPPIGFGFHNEIKNFKVMFTPYYLGRPDLVGQPEPITFTVQNIGMSPGAGFEIPLIVTVVVIVVLLYYFFIMKRKK